MTPYGAGVILTTEASEASALQAYRQASRRITVSPMPTFGSTDDAGIPGIIGHLAVWCGPDGIADLDIAPGGVLVLDAWNDEDRALSTYQSTIMPAIEQAGLQPDPLTDLELIGFMAAPASELSAFSAQDAYSHIVITSHGMLDDVDIAGLYAATTGEAISGTQLPAGLGLHYAFRTEDRLVVVETWRSRAHYRNFEQGRLGTAIRHVFDLYEVKGEPDTVEVNVLGASTPDHQIIHPVPSAG